MEGLLYEKKVKDMQKYIPFLENLITKLEKTQDGQTKSRESQLAKMRMLYGLLTKKDKKLKLDTLVKCESVLAKLYKKVEQQNIAENESQVDKTINRPPEKTEKSKDNIESAELSAPASPQNSDSTVEFHAPIVIPTERANSPNYGTSHRYRDKDTFDNNRNKEKYDRYGHKNSDSKTELYRRRSPGRYDSFKSGSSSNRYSDKSSSNYDKFENRKDRRYDESRNSSDRLSYDRNKYYERRPYSNSPNNEMWKSHESRTTAQQNSSTNSGKATVTTTSPTPTTAPSLTSTSTPTPASTPTSTSISESLKNRDTVFHRLGGKLDIANLNNYENFKIKIKNDKLKKKRAPTPLSEVLNSPPLSANDIDDLMNESGEKGDARKMEENKLKKELSELEAVRKKLNHEIGNCKKKAKESSSAKGTSSKSTDKFSSSFTKSKLQSLSKTLPEENDRKDDLSTVKTCKSPSTKETNREKKSSQIEKSVESNASVRSIKSPSKEKQLSQIEMPFEKKLQELPDIQSPSTEESDRSNVRLAYKYNPHPRRSIDSSPKSEETIQIPGKSIQNIVKPIDPRVNRTTINTMPMSVNMADPRLRNRPILSVPPPNIMDVNISNPTFPPLDVRRQSTHSIFSIFGGNYQQQIPKPVPSPVTMSNQLIRPVNPQNIVPNTQIPNQISPVASMSNQMSRPVKPPQPVAPPSLLTINVVKPLEPVPSNLNYNKFQPMLNDQVERMKYLESKKYRFEPKTYGEYKQAKLAEKKHKEPYRSPISRRKSVDNMPSCLDKLYRKSEFKQDVPSVSNFKIPKVTKPKSEETGKEIYSVSSDDETSNVKDTKKSDKPEEKKEKSKTQGMSNLDKDKNTTKDEKQLKKLEKTDEKQKTEQKPKIKATIGKDSEEKSSKSDDQKKNNKQTKSESLDEKQVSKKINESAKQKKSSSETTSDKKPELEEEKIVETPGVLPKNSTENSNKEEEKKETCDENKNAKVETKLIDDAEVPVKPQPRRRKSVYEYVEIVASSSDASLISTQNIITGKRRTRSVIPPPSETKQTSSPERKVPSKRKSKTVIVISESETESHHDEMETKIDLHDSKDEKPAVKNENEETKSEGLIKVRFKEESEACAVSSTTPGCSEEPHSLTVESVDVKKEEVKSDVTKEWLEGFLLNIFNPSLMNKDSVLNMLEKVLDDKKFKQIKAIMDENQEDKKEKIIPDSVAVPEEKPVEAPSEDKKEIEIDYKEEEPKTTIEHKQHKKHKTELDRLNEDIRDMFISQGVLTATGRRMCTVINEEKKVDDKPKPPSKQVQKHVKGSEKIPKDKQSKMSKCGKTSVKRLGGKKDGRGRPKGSYKRKRVLPKRSAKLNASFEDEGYEIIENENDLNTPYNVSESSSSELDDAMPVLEAQTTIKTPEKEKPGLELEETIVRDNKTKKKYKPCPKSKRKIQIDSDEESDNDSDHNKEDALARTAEKVEDQAEIIIEDDRTDFLSAVIEQNDSDMILSNEELSRVNTSPQADKKGSKRRVRKTPFYGMGTEINTSFKNTNPDMHVKSAYIDKCILCGFVGRRMCNHYVHAHPDSEVPISRLPPEVLELMKTNPNKALFSYKKVDNNTVYYYKCPFCDTRSSLTRRGWIDHFGTHTGEYAFKCSDCNRYLNLKQMIQKHIKHSCPNGRIINLRTMDKEKKRVSAYVCDICNYLQMNRYTIIKHLLDQHDEDKELITTVTLISCENVLRADDAKRAAIINEYEKGVKANFGEDRLSTYMAGSSERSLTFIADELSERLRETEDSVNLDMFQHSIFNDMSIVERLSERLQADLNKQTTNNSQEVEMLDPSNNITTNLNMSSDAESYYVGTSDNSMLATTLCETSISDIHAASESGEPSNDQNESLSSGSMANRLSQRFGVAQNENSSSNQQQQQQENDNLASFSMADRLCQRFSVNSEHDKPRDLNDNTQSIMYIVDKIDEHIATAEHVKADEIKVPSNEKDSRFSLLDILSQRRKDNETPVSVPLSPVPLRSNISESEKDTQSISENFVNESDSESTVSLVERIKMRLNTGKNDSTTTTTTTNQTSTSVAGSTSIVERLGERLQNTSALVSPHKASALHNHSTPKSRMSIVERLSQRLKSTTAQDVSPELTLIMPDDAPEPLPSTSNCSESNKEVLPAAVRKSFSNDVDSSYEGELIIDEEDGDAAMSSKTTKTVEPGNDVKHAGQAKASDLTETIIINSSQDEADSEITEILDNDDDWIDIETLPSKPAKDSKRQDKGKKNKLTFETFSRLYAFNSQKNRIGSSKKEKNNKKALKSSENCTLNTESVNKSEDKVIETNDREKIQEKDDVCTPNISSSTTSTVTRTKEEAPKVMDTDPLALPAEVVGQLNVVNDPIPWSAPVTSVTQNTTEATKRNENDPLELPVGTEGQFHCLTSSITSFPSTTAMSTVISGITPTITTVSSPLARDLGDISGLLGLNTNQVNPQQPTDPLEVNDISSTLFVLSDPTSLQEAVNIVSALDVNIQEPKTSTEIPNPVDAVATEERKSGFEIVESKSNDCHNGTTSKGFNSAESASDRCSSAVSSCDPTVISSPVIHRIDKLGYSKSMENLIKYHCLVDSCSFLYSELPIGLQNHFITEHTDILWEGYCYSCEANVCNDEAMSLSREYKHMLEVHVKSFTDIDKVAKPTENNIKPPVIKLRRLSGDILSVNQEPQEQDFPVSETPKLEHVLNQQPPAETQDDDHSVVTQNQPKIHNKTTEPEKDFPLLKVTTKTSIINVSNKTNSSPANQKSMLDTYLVRNNVPKIKGLVIAKIEEGVKDTPIIVNNPSSSMSSDLKISSVAQNVNQDLIQQQNSANEAFFKIKEVVSLSTLNRNAKLVPTSTTTTMPVTNKGYKTQSTQMSGKLNVLQIQSPSSSTSENNTGRHSILLKPVKKPINSPLNNMSNLKIQSVTSMASVSNDQLVQADSYKIKDQKSDDGVQPPTNITTNVLKPWIYSKSYKSKHIVDKLLRDICLYSLFKCMGHECAFTTNSEQMMMHHLRCHTDALEPLKDNEGPHQHSGRECPYCADSHVTNKNFVTHVLQIHGKDIYQCPYCFYRSCVDHNVIIHLKAFHRNREKAVLVCFGEQRRLATEIRDLAKFRTENVRQIKCLDCMKSFYIVRNYVKHIKEHYPQNNSYKCYLCFAFVNKNLAEKHLLTRHNIGVYECIYCIFATENMSMMRCHVSNRHPSCLSYMCVRLSPNKNFDSTDETLESSTVLANLAESVEEEFLRRCPYTLAQLNATNPTLSKETNMKDKAILVNSHLQSSLIMTQKSKDLEIASVQSISSEVFDNLEDRSKMPPPETSNDKESMLQLQPSSSKQFFPILPPSSSSMPPPPSIVSMQLPFSSTAPSMSELQLSSDSDIINRERTYIRILEAAREMVQSTGFQGPELYKCAQCEQPPQIDTAMNFHLHLQEHITLGTTEVKCYHCAYNTKNLIALKNHLKIHCGHRYFCYFCNYTGSTAKSLIKHISDSHSKTGMILYPLIYGQTNKTKDFFVICPKNVTPNDLIQFGERMVRAWERKKALTKKYFTPDEIDLLPRQAIFFNEVNCQVCNYRTKVRTNMFRHLQFHKQEVKVATVDPVNPVPCLNSNERHFDKMVNLACSSNVNKDFRTAAKEEPKVPEFVPHMKRYVCGVPGCTYLTISENMMKWHLSALHSSEKIFICAHCSAEVCKKNICGERILEHLKFHDSKLFLCGECNFMHYQKPLVEEHINEKHPTGPCSIISYERDGTDTIKSTDPVAGRKNPVVTTPPTVSKDDDMKWECGLCKARRATYNQMVSHMNRTHEVKNRYQCVHCSFGGAQVTNIVVHVAEKHPTKVKEARCMFYKLNENPAEHKMLDHTTPIWTRDPGRVKNVRGILMEDEEESQRNLLLDDNYEEENEEESISNSEVGISDGVGGGSSSSSKELSAAASGINSPKEPGNLNTANMIKTPKTYGSASKKDEIKSCEQCTYSTKSSAKFQYHMKTFDHKALFAEMDQFIFFCYHCRGSYKANTIQGVAKHWAKKHEIVKTDGDNGLTICESPFWFQFSPKVACGRCSYKSEIQTVVRHHQHYHSGTHIALVSINNSKQCSQCPYLYTQLEDLGTHFSLQHPKITTPPISITDNLLEKFLKLGMKQKLIKCLQCNYIPVVTDCFTEHHKKCHPNTTPTYEYTQDEILYLCTQCSFVSTDETILLRHMYDHPFNCTYKCTCSSKHKIFSEFVEHLDKVHHSKPNQFTVTKCIESKVRQLKELKVVLPNGLLIEKSQLDGTKYGDATNIENIAKEEFSKYLNPQNEPKKNIPDKVSDSESESLSSSADESYRSSRDRKRRDVNKSGKYENDDNWTPKGKSKRSRSNASSKRSQSTSSKQSQKIVKMDKAASDSNRKPEKVDLSKIYTTMTIAGSDVPISCDRFAKLVKIKTCVRVERIDISKYLTNWSVINPGKRKSKNFKNESNKKLKTS